MKTGHGLFLFRTNFPFFSAMVWELPEVTVQVSFTQEKVDSKLYGLKCRNFSVFVLSRLILFSFYSCSRNEYCQINNLMFYCDSCESAAPPESPWLLLWSILLILGNFVSYSKPHKHSLLYGLWVRSYMTSSSRGASFPSFRCTSLLVR